MSRYVRVGGGKVHAAEVEVDGVGEAVAVPVTAGHPRDPLEIGMPPKFFCGHGGLAVVPRL